MLHPLAHPDRPLTKPRVFKMGEWWFARHVEWQGSIRSMKYRTWNLAFEEALRMARRVQNAA